MVATDILLLSLILTIVTTDASNYELTSGDYRCPDTNETCIITCSANQVAKDDIIDCGYATTCIYHCNAYRCNENGEILARNVSQLQIIQGSDADECLRGTAIYTPSNGSALLQTATSSRRPYRNTIIYGGTSESIIISADSISRAGDDLKGFEVK